MKSISEVSGVLAEFLVQNQEETGPSKAVLAFGIEIIILFVADVVVLSLLAYLLGIFKFTLMIVFWSFLFRLISGGVHCSSFWRCLLVSQAVFLPLGYLSTLLISYTTQEELQILWFILAAVMVFITWKWVPADNPNRPITRPEEVRKFKGISLIFLTVCSLMFVALTFFNFGTVNGMTKMLLATGFIGIGCQGLSVTPWGYKLIGKLDFLLARGMKTIGERR